MSDFSVPRGMPRSVWENKYARKTDGTGRQGNVGEEGFQTWGERVAEVVQGNFLLDPRPREIFEPELEETLQLAQAGILPFSGRHLQHGDLRQPDRNMEIFSNCSTAIFSFTKFLLLLKGSGVGRCYDSDVCRVDWNYMPNTRFVLDEKHPDFEEGFESLAEARHKYDSESEEVRWFQVEDSGEGWVKIIEILETAAFQHKHENKLFIFDFSKIRCKGTPIKGQQGRPASGPGPFMNALKKVSSIKGAGMKPWKQAMFIDHYLSSCVAVGGIRRCLPVGTLVQSESGLIPIETVNIGCQVKTSKGFSVVTDTLDQGVQAVSRIKTQMGSFDCTKDHRIAVMLDYNGNYTWKNAGELKPGDRLVFPSHEIPGTKTSLPEFSYTKPKHSTTCVDIKIPELTPEIAWFLGLFAGDGYISDPVHRGYGTVALHQDQLDIKERAQNALNSFGIASSYKEFEGKQAKLKFKSKQLGIFLREHIKKPNEALKVPEFILQGLPSIRAAYVAGLFDADGSSRTRSLQVVSSIYKSYVLEVQALLVSLGIASVIKEKKRKEKGWKTIYILSIKGETFKERFTKKVSCFSSKFSVGNANVTQSSHAYGFPAEWIDFPNKHEWSPKNAQMLTETFTKITGQEVSLFPIEVLEVKLDCYECPTFDITVEADEFALGSGILVHNSARIATKSWRDKDVIEFIDIKRVDSEIAKLYTANNSITVDAEFWKQAAKPEPSHARRVFEAAVGAAYFDQTGEPGFLNVDLLTNNETGLSKINKDNYISEEYKRTLNLHPKTMEMIEHTLKWVDKKKYKFIVNPCGEIILSMKGGFCVIGDICLANVVDKQDAINAAGLLAKFLMRVNLMPSLYKTEVDRTNRIGVGLTGIHEFAYKNFDLTFWDLLDENKSFEFWSFIDTLRRAVESSSVDFAEKTNTTIPHTFTTIKPSGTISKVMNCTEGAHLPAMPHYIRWVQYALNDSAVVEHKNRGYPIKDISSQYSGHCVIGFPTKLPISDLMGDKVVTSREVSPGEQYEWLRLLEKYWLGGKGSNNQISYTLKYNPKELSYLEFSKMILENQPTVKACSVMPSINESAYAYVPEERITKEEYDNLVSKIKLLDKEAVDSSRLDCDGGACPIEPDIN